MVLPLPLVPFEAYMLADDRRAYPMNLFVRLRFTGRFDRSALDQAMSVAVSRHPLLAAMAHRSGRRWVWRAADKPPAVHWLDAEPEESLPSLEPLDVRVAPGLRAVVCEGQERTDIILQNHHACCDGLGMFRFAEDLLISYAHARGVGPRVTLRALHPEQLRGRGTFGLTVGKLLRMLPNHVAGLLGARQFLMRKPEPLVAHLPQPEDSPPPSGYPASRTCQLDESETAGVMAAVQSMGVTVNDLLAREFFLSLARWQRGSACDRRRTWLRLCVPVSLRTAAEDRLPAANVVSMVFLDRHPQDTKEPEQLLMSIHEEMLLIKRLQLGLTFVLSLQVCQWLRGGLSWMGKNRRCMATAVLSNPGVLFGDCPLADDQGRVAIGDNILEDIDFLVPMRPLTCAAIAAYTYAGRLRFALHYDPRVLAADHAAELIDSLAEGVRGSAVGRPRALTEAGV